MRPILGLEDEERISLKTIRNYLRCENNVPVPLFGSDSCVLLVKPLEGVEMQLRSAGDQINDIETLPQLTRLDYKNGKTLHYSYLGVFCEASQFSETVLSFFYSIAINFVHGRECAETSIRKAHDQWKDLLSRPSIPSEEVLLGLWGELLVIDMLLGKRVIPAETIIGNWTGPMGYPNDFSIGNSCVEIKTTRRQNNSIVVSSLDQLDAQNSWLVLVRAFHETVERGGETVGILANRISSKLDVSLKDIFKDRVDRLFPISEIHEADRYSWIADGTPLAFRVRPDWPVLSRRRLSLSMSYANMEMLSFVKYCIDLTPMLSSAINDIGEVFQRILVGGGDNA